MLFFFFSSRRRHTRFDCDWSSDVCSSDLGGMDAVEQALRSGATKTGATVHLVIEDIDAGPILAQESVPVLKDDTVETLRRRIHEAEYRILPAAIRLLEARLAESPAIGQ